jgi:hypothetical protein
METAARPNSHNWFWIASLWAGLAILDATQNVFAMRHAGMHHAWVKLSLVLTLDWLPFALCLGAAACQGEIGRTRGGSGAGNAAARRAYRRA